MFGREAKPLPLLPTKPPYLWSPQDAVTETVQRIIRAKNFAHENIQLAQERQRRNYNRHAKDRTDIQPGDEVLLYLPRRGKFTPRWETNWKVKKLIGEVNVQITHNHKGCRIVHLNRIRKAHKRRPVSVTEWRPTSIYHEQPDLVIRSSREVDDNTEVPATSAGATTRPRRMPNWTADYIMY
ncbi:hypothetical protein M514_14294, partial [Trichuris suis]|uniref:Integrase zinc-binding domain-containing protein n=1 Tax=Trichuris suis TaxID=68888 RepID=A0A085LIN3_9BILA